MAQRCTDTFLYKAIDLANTCDLNYRASRNKRLLVELTLIQLCQLMRPVEEDKKKARIEAINPAPSTSQPTSQTRPATMSTQIPPKQVQSVTAPHISATPQPQKHTARPPMNTSLKNMVNTKARTDSAQTGQTQKTDLQASFTEEELIESWNAYANSVGKKIFLKNIMLNNLPKLQENFYFEVVVHNPAMQEELFNNAIDILGALRNRLKNSHIQMRVRISEGNEKHLAYTSTEKYEHLVEINPLLDKLAKEFDLRAD